MLIFNQYIDDWDTTSFPPAGTLITNGEPIGSTGWQSPLNGSSFSTGYMTVVGGSADAPDPDPGRISYATGNWSIRQLGIFANNGVTTYTVGFEARRIGTTTGRLQCGRGYSVFFDNAVTTSWVQYEVTAAANANTWAGDIVFGATETGDTYEVRNVYVLQN